MSIKRVPPQPNELPYYFTWTAILRDGTRVPQYDERQRVVRWADVVEDIECLEVYVHPAFLTNTPVYVIEGLGEHGGAELEYHGRKAAEVDIPYHKQQMIVRYINLYVNGADGPDPVKQEVIFEPNDLESAGREPDDLYTVRIR